MRTIRTIVVDDETLGRNRIKHLLDKVDYVQVIGEGRTGIEAIDLIRTYKPDLLFLDVEMPDKNGFDVLNTFQIEALPVIIFVTAHDRFALRAFDFKATDYLLKPFDDLRFMQAFDYAVKRIEERDKGALNDQILRIVEDFRSKRSPVPFVLHLKEKGRTLSINLYDVLYIEADGNYLKLQLEKERHLVRNTMQQMILELDRSCFLRIHRSIIINTNCLKSKQYRGNNEYCLKLNNGSEFVSGRSFKDEIDFFFSTQKLH